LVVIIGCPFHFREEVAESGNGVSLERSDGVVGTEIHDIDGVYESEVYTWEIGVETPGYGRCEDGGEGGLSVFAIVGIGSGFEVCAEAVAESVVYTGVFRDYEDGVGISVVACTVAVSL
jgi:hypothetical protein